MALCNLAELICETLYMKLWHSFEVQIGFDVQYVHTL